MILVAKVMNVIDLSAKVVSVTYGTVTLSRPGGVTESGGGAGEVF